MRFFFAIFFALTVLSCGAGEWLAVRLKPRLIARKEASAAADAARLRCAFMERRGKMETPAEGLVIPLKTHDDGSPFIEVLADRAQYFEVTKTEGEQKTKTRFVLCEGARVRQFAPGGSVVIDLTAQECFADLSTGSAWLEGAVNGNYLQNPFKGDGIYFSSEDFFVKIFSQVEISLDL